MVKCEICDSEFTEAQYKKHSKSCGIVKPILKWVGGKTQILDVLFTKFPAEMNNYREIFLGGGSVLFALLSRIKFGKIRVNGTVFAYDANEPLIWVYKNIQSDHNELYDTLQTLIRELNECGDGTLNRAPANIDEAKQLKENYYYWIRSEYNKCDQTSIAGSAMFIFLNKTCFRGLFRIGPHGFNVPYGHYNNPAIIDKPHLTEIHELIQDVVFECCDFTESLATVDCDDYIYLDRPYCKETDTSFVGYTSDGFGIKQHTELFNILHELPSRFMLSNADVPFVRDQFSKYNITSLLCKRSINSKHPDAKAKEVIITN